MQKRILKIMAAVLAAGMVMAGFGCGEETPSALTSGSTDEFNSKLEELKNAEMTVEIIINGQTEGKWSQNGSGSWRWEPSEAEADQFYVIYNADQMKTFIVTGSTATEQSGSAPAGPYQHFSPAMLLSSFGALAHLPRTGEEGDTWQWDISGAGLLTVEFKGPEGLISKIIDEDDLTGETDVTEFNYSEVGNVPDSTFEVPAGIPVETPRA